MTWQLPKSLKGANYTIAVAMPNVPAIPLLSLTDSYYLCFKNQRYWPTTISNSSSLLYGKTARR